MLLGCYLGFEIFNDLVYPRKENKYGTCNDDNINKQYAYCVAWFNVEHIEQWLHDSRNDECQWKNDSENLTKLSDRIHGKTPNIHNKNG